MMKRNKGGVNQKASHIDNKVKNNSKQVDEYNLKIRSNTLNKFSQHLPADKNKQRDTKSYQEINRQDEGLTTIQESQITTSTYLRLDQKIDEQEERRNDLQTSLINKIEEVKSDLIARGDAIRTELEGKIASAKSDNRSHINQVMTWIISITGIILTIASVYIIYNIHENSKNIEELKKFQTEIKIKLETPKDRGEHR